MKNRTNQILLVVTIVTAALYAFFLLIWLEIIPNPLYNPDDPFRYTSLLSFLGIRFSFIPCFCLQLLVCRVAKRPIVRLIPVFLLVGIVAASFISMVNSTDWDGLGWVLLLLLCVAPALGCILGWVVYGLSRGAGK